MLQFCSFSNSLSHTTLSIKCRSLLLCRYDSACIWVYNTTTYWHYVFMGVSNRPQHSILIISPSYTPSFITITYKSYNINTIHIANKNNHHNSPPINHTFQTYHAYMSYHIFISYIYFLNFVMIIFFSLVINLLHTHTHKKTYQILTIIAVLT